jgi:NAD(P)-dependent dehydrogenase (short-subunit alcohol dehydrogenase family)
MISKTIERMLDLSGRVALVTGAGAGIGKASAEILAEAGAHVAASDADEASARTTAETIRGQGGSAEAIRLDVTDEATIKGHVAGLLQRAGRIDILVNNAGIGAREPSETMSIETWRRVSAVNVDGAFVCTREAGRAMLARGSGSVVTIASIMGISGGGLYPNLAYHTSKGALINFTRALAVEWGPRGVRVNAIAPTFARTRLTQKLLSDDKMRGEIERLTPLGRLAEPGEVAAAVLYLASDAAAMVTGHTLAVDGGWLAR